MYNLISCSGWTSNAASFIGSSECIKSKIGLVILFFLIAIVRKWGGEEIGISYNFLMGLIGGILPYIIIVILFGSFKIALVVGILGALLLGYGSGLIFGDGGDY